MADTQGQANGGRPSATGKRPIARHPSSWETNLEEEMPIPGKQPGSTPPEDDAPQDGTWGNTSDPWPGLFRIKWTRN